MTLGALIMGNNVSLIKNVLVSLVYDVLDNYALSKAVAAQD